MNYIFGYGSLIYEGGINGRRMKRRYTDDDLTVATLAGYKRSWEVEHQGVRYLVFALFWCLNEM